MKTSRTETPVRYLPTSANPLIFSERDAQLWALALARPEKVVNLKVPHTNAKYAPKKQ
ncbi:hypothetical protein KP803_09940 [Vibrio sp. ZSDE26]|uniref:Uncharacterized protein n=1 Tax=Vibrio amylolyticus TaxID=2847292 RepID=A0A9X1XJJ1_9VIBR|nr:hypothetical protein [Vibrio amylolyticus]MCK6263591.1 hypothetical protein [Vibrio amylolyticus]